MDKRGANRRLRRNQRRASPGAGARIADSETLLGLQTANNAMPGTHWFGFPDSIILEVLK
jgi:hypothetical protein